MITADLRDALDRWDIDDTDDLAFWQGIGSRAELHTALTETLVLEFMGDDDALTRYLCQHDTEIRDDARVLWAWVQAGCPLPAKGGAT
jgi:hypothetical protein